MEKRMFKSFIEAAVLLFSFTALAAPVVTLTAPVSGKCGRCRRQHRPRRIL
jgi:hypothetical protein